jgi:hypothetical protein
MFDGVLTLAISDPLDERFKAFMAEYRAFRTRQEREAKFRQAAFDNPRSMYNLDEWRKAQSGLRDDQTNLDIKAAALLKDIAGAHKMPIDFMKDEPITAGEFRGTTARFDPKFAFEDWYVSRRKTADGRTLTWSRDYSRSEASATTMPTGEVVFRMRAFDVAASYDSDAVGVLASTIYHEVVHFREVMKDPTMKTERSELAAYGAVVEIQTYIFGLPQRARERNEEKVKEYEQKIDKDQRAKFRYAIGGWLPRWPGTGPDLLTTFHPTESRWEELGTRAARLEAPLNDINADRDALRERIRKEKTVRGDYAGRVRREREALFGPDAPPQPAAPPAPSGIPCGAPPCLPTPVVRRPMYPSIPAPAVPAAPAEPPAQVATAPVDLGRLAEMNMVRLTNLACSAQDQLSQSDFDALWQTIHRAPITVDSRDKFGLQGCAWTLYGELALFSRDPNFQRLSMDWIRQRVVQIQVPVTDSEELRDAPRAPDRPRCRWAGDWCK